MVFRSHQLDDDEQPPHPGHQAEVNQAGFRGRDREGPDVVKAMTPSFAEYARLYVRPATMVSAVSTSVISSDPPLTWRFDS